MRNRGFTIVELLICMAVLSIVVAVAFPVYNSARNRSKETQRISTIRNLGMSITLYRTQNEKDGLYGSAPKMGLPRYFGGLGLEMGLPPASFHCSLPFPGSNRDSAFTQLYHFPDEDQDWPRWDVYCDTYRDDSVLLADFRHDPNYNLLRSPYVQHQAIGLFVGGYVKKVTKLGDPRTRTWWNN